MKMKPQCPYRVMKSRFHLEDYLSCLACNDLEKKKKPPKKQWCENTTCHTATRIPAVRGSVTTKRPHPGRRRGACPVPGMCHHPTGDVCRAGRAWTKPPGDADANRVLPSHAASPSIVGSHRDNASPQQSWGMRTAERFWAKGCGKDCTLQTPREAGRPRWGPLYPHGAEAGHPWWAPLRLHGAKPVGGAHPPSPSSYGAHYSPQELGTAQLKDPNPRRGQPCYKPLRMRHMSLRHQHPPS